MTTMMTKRTRTEAERQQARYNLLTPSAVADRLQNLSSDPNPKAKITPDTVRGWIEDARPRFRLRAVDMRGEGAARPRWFTEWEWVEDFLNRRGNMSGGNGAS